MELYRLAMIVPFLAGAVLATPVGLPAGPPVIIRVFPSVRVCKDVNFGPPCNTVLSNYNECVNVPDGYNDKISSLQPNKEAGNCRFFQHINCNGPSFDSLYPGFDDLTTQLPEFNDQISSWQCYGRLPALNGPVPIK
ncbi:hypothetical protein TsFJ059_007329 [Trichoderma semiorbis]|uniref:Uncharacterized protein n=1 Tax=Trichoderma semiorbis TaxID=1491008 RepID=A0A9P8HJA7_9HYPO|nr:hypothetical protein TsFJ059_007329 [Trichoderma semiorbis]